MKSLTCRAALLSVVFVLCSQSLFAQSATTLDVTMTVDNAFQAYISTSDSNTPVGALVGSGNDWTDPQSFNTALTPNVVNYLHIYAENFAGGGTNPAAFLGQFSLNNAFFEFPNDTQYQLTNAANWEVSTVGYGGPYAPAASLGVNGDGPWGLIAAIDASANWIWNNDASPPDTPVYFRLQIDPTTVDIALSKTESIDPVIAGSGLGNLTYTVTAINNGQADASGVVISEVMTLPAGVTVASVTPSAGTFTDPSWNLGALAAGASATLTVVLTVDSTAATGTDVISNTATVTAVNEFDYDNANDSVTESTSVLRNVDIQVTKTESIDPVVAGSGPGNLTYTVTAYNAGPSAASGVILSEALTLPAGVTIDSITPSGTTTYAPPNGPAGTWTVGDLAAGGTETLTVVLTADPTTAAGTDVISNTATLTAVAEIDTNAGNDTATEATSVLRQIDIAVSKVESLDPVIAGSGPGNLTYTVTATNNGPSDASGVTLSEVMTLPAGVTVDSVTPSGTTGWADPTWTIGDLAQGASETLTVVLTVGSSAAVGTDVISNTATLTASNETDTVPGNNTATEATSVVREVDVVISKVESIDPVVAGSGNGNLEYTITAQNLGPSDVTGLIVNEALTLPTGVTIAEVVPSSGGWVEPDWTVNIPAGTSETLTVSLTVASNAVVATDSILNTANVTGTGGNELLINIEDDFATENTSVAREVEFEITKESNIDTVVAGSGVGNLVFTSVLTNLGPSDVTGANFSTLLNLPAGVTVESIVSNVGTIDDTAAPLYSYTVDLAAGASDTVTTTMTVALVADEGTNVVGSGSSLNSTAGGESVTNDGEVSANTTSSVRWPYADFNVSKAYEDDPGPQVPMQLECTDASDIKVYDLQAGTSPNTFTVRRFDHDLVATQGTSCTVTETAATGYYEVDRSADCDVAQAADEGDYNCVITNAVTNATFHVTKQFSDGNTDPVDVSITCNQGLPLHQTFTISEGNPVTFTVLWFAQGEMDCEITEVGYDGGYTMSFDNGTEVSDMSCAYTDVAAGEYTCEIFNSADMALYTVGVDWELVDPNVVQESYPVDITVSCSADIQTVNGVPVSPSQEYSGTLDDGESVVLGVDTTFGTTICSTSHDPGLSYVETETTEDCTQAALTAGSSVECHILNTIFFEGIPTLSQYGKALLALLMLGVGFVGFRRFV